LNYRQGDTKKRENMRAREDRYEQKDKSVDGDPLTSSISLPAAMRSASIPCCFIK